VYSSLVVATPPAVEPVCVTLARKHARIDFVDDDDLIAFYLTSARQAAENYLGRVLITQTLQWTMSETPPNGSMPLLPIPLMILPLILSSPQIMNKPFELPRSPAQSIESVTVTDSDGNSTVLVADQDYTADLTTDPGRIKLHWLTTPSRLLHVQVMFVAGYGDPDEVPLAIRHAVMLGMTAYYENRGDTSAEMPRAFYDLLTPYRVVYFGSPGYTNG
jgi:hypothetical protein